MTEYLPLTPEQIAEVREMVTDYEKYPGINITLQKPILLRILDRLKDCEEGRT